MESAFQARQKETVVRTQHLFCNAVKILPIQKFVHMLFWSFVKLPFFFSPNGAAQDVVNQWHMSLNSFIPQWAFMCLG